MSERITYMGNQVYPKPKRIVHRDRKGKFSVRRFSYILYAIAAFLLFVVFAPLFSNWMGEQNKKSNLTFLAAPPAYAGVVAPTMESKVEDLKESILDRLAACESGGKKEADGIAILDSNNVGSYGIFQFQRKTVMHYQKLRGTDINGRDAIILALQGDKARELAKWIIFDTKAGVAQDWVVCSRKHGLQAEVDILKKLTQ